MDFNGQFTGNWACFELIKFGPHVAWNSPCYSMLFLEWLFPDSTATVLQQAKGSKVLNYGVFKVSIVVILVLSRYLTVELADP